jgi:hypothetical protein
MKHIRFVPKKDITLNELAEIVRIITIIPVDGGGGKQLEDYIDKLPDNIKRHIEET